MHGSHSHRFDQFPDLKRCFDVGVDPNNYTPVRLSDIITKLIQNDSNK